MQFADKKREEARQAGVAYGLEGRVALITGGGRNIGEAISLGFAGAGAIPVIMDLNLRDAEAVAHKVEVMGGRALALKVDVSNPQEVEAAVARVARELGSVDVLVNNAAKFSELKYRDFAEIPLDEWRAVLEVNITGVFICVRAVDPYMRAARWGRIINISSGTIRMGRPHFLHYVSSKSALVGMGRSLARELGPFGVTVNTVLPGVAFTALQQQRLDEAYRAFILRMQCIPQPMDASALAGPVVFLASEAAAFVTGQELAVDGGLTHG